MHLLLNRLASHCLQLFLSQPVPLVDCRPVGVAAIALRGVRLLIANVIAWLLVRIVVASEIMHLLRVKVVEDVLAEVAVGKVDCLEVLEQLLQLHVVNLPQRHAAILLDLRPRIDLYLLLMLEFSLNTRQADEVADQIRLLGTMLIHHDLPDILL